MMRFICCALALLLLQPGVLPAQTSAINPKYEFRGAWIATVNNIDWPSSKYLTADAQKQEYINLLNRLQQTGINAVIVQVRPSADAFYQSKYEPWSEYLTGRQGVPPSPFYDPLAFMIDETHRRGMEFHAWINPYRAMQSPSSTIAAGHISKARPGWFVKYGDRKYFNPGIPAVRKYLTDVVIDIITHYDVDAIHMDDYFYPYRIAGKEFPDLQAYKQYGNGLSKAAWRRSNCDSIVKMLHDSILKYRPMIKFGISPFGVWRNNSVDPRGSDTKAGQTCYDDLYADVLLWLKNEWIDYAVPQLYWEIGHKLCDYETLLNWWSENSYGKQLYIGHGVYRAIEKPTPAWRNTNELPNEIRMLRNDANVQGSVYYSTKHLLYNPNGWVDSLRFNYYRTPALIAPMPWVDTVGPQPPRITKINVDEDNSVEQFIVSGDGLNKNETENIKSFVVYLSQSIIDITNTPAIIIPAGSNLNYQFLLQSTNIPAAWKHCYVGVTSVDRENNESAVSNLLLLEKTFDGWQVKK